MLLNIEYNECKCHINFCKLNTICDDFQEHLKLSPLLSCLQYILKAMFYKNIKDGKQG